MPIRTSVQQIWHQSPSGLVVPGGAHTYLASLAYPTFLQIKEKAVALEHLYTTSNVRLAPTCDLGQLIADAKVLSDTWLLGQGSHGITHTLLLRVGYLYRIANAMLPLRDVLKRTTYLTAMTSGRLDCFARTDSKAKDILWELELWDILRWRSFDAVLDEPDIVVRSDGAKIGIACKKLYSEKHVQRVLSKAVDQIENSSCDVGIVAITIEDCVLPRKILTFSTHKAMRQALDHCNLQFLHVHERHFRKYLASGRLVSALVSTVAPVNILHGKGYHHARESTFWTIPGLSQEKEHLLQTLYTQFMGK